jgi:hypothetical protein
LVEEFIEGGFAVFKQIENIALKLQILMNFRRINLCCGIHGDVQMHRVNNKYV